MGNVLWSCPLQTHSAKIKHNCRVSIIFHQWRKHLFVVVSPVCQTNHDTRFASHQNQRRVNHCSVARGVLDALSERWTSHNRASPQARSYLSAAGLDDSYLQGCKVINWLRLVCSTPHLPQICEAHLTLGWHQQRAVHLQRLVTLANSPVSDSTKHCMECLEEHNALYLWNICI